MLTNKQKRFLRSKSHPIQPIFQVGKAGVNENMITQINEALEVRELIKVSILQNCMEDKDSITAEMVEGTKAHVVQVIGSTIILYKKSVNNPKLQLPN
ncbi:MULTISPECIES: ribosome assembly RNA-binding protein YhbY [Shouchella]|uniref:Ribosome assembly RNA-binding protein YhbY n=2 Tax=Shouchella TaxID=2893057 RepID=A0ABY7W560_9BACI|nr:MULTISPECIES: ribosome assembly RNA-binding protein YhbY [Shouchella]MED4127848.1 ribosome assembly RNA-binding protein YhbY [Shouchella miscanthi]WDF02997.1 ribosome assembly RNA-binding protein YhbY [Shouchella hunanensis]